MHGVEGPGARRLGLWQTLAIRAVIWRNAIARRPPRISASAGYRKTLRADGPRALWGVGLIPSSGTCRTAPAFFLRHGQPEESVMPVFILWAVPAVFVLGGVTYLIVK
jgi:hypothetical protein